MVVHEIRSGAAPYGKKCVKLVKVRLTGHELPFNIIVLGIRAFPGTTQFLELTMTFVLARISTSWMTE
jgi:hypothetical protein